MEHILWNDGTVCVAHGCQMGQLKHKHKCQHILMTSCTCVHYFET